MENSGSTVSAPGAAFQGEHRVDLKVGEALVLESALVSNHPPLPRTLEAFRNHFENENDREGPFSTLGGLSANILDDADDLMALRTPLDEDRLTKLLRYYLPVLFVVRLAQVLILIL